MGSGRRDRGIRSESSERPREAVGAAQAGGIGHLWDAWVRARSPGAGPPGTGSAGSGPTRPRRPPAGLSTPHRTNAAESCQANLLSWAGADSKGASAGPTGCRPSRVPSRGLAGSALHPAHPRPGNTSGLAAGTAGGLRVLTVAQRSGKITFYEGKHFTGRKLEVFGDCDNFQDRGFMNRVNSIRVESGAWIGFYHPDFQGQQFILEHGDYPDFFRWNSHNDHVGSCRPVGMHGEHFRLEIFEGCNFTGQCLELTEDCPFLLSQGWAKNCVNSIKVFGDGAWVLYEEPNYHGRMFVVERGDFRSFTDWEAPSARVQSLRRVVNFF
nr:gamma-crystallin N [Dasypus novemcinctus]